MKLYRRYLIREVAAAILLVLVAFLALFGFFDLIAELKNVGQGGYQLQHAALFVLLRLPGRIYELMPVAVLSSGGVEGGAKPWFTKGAIKAAR